MTAPNEPTITVDAHLVIELCDDLAVLEDWLLHCGSYILDELADFAYHANYSPRNAVEYLISDLGHYGVTLRRLAQPTRPH